MINIGQIIKTQVKSHFEETQRTPINYGNNLDLPPTLNERFCTAVQGFYSVNWVRQYCRVLDAVYKSCQSLSNIYKSCQVKQLLFASILLDPNVWFIFRIQWPKLSKIPCFFSINMLHINENHPRAEELLKRWAFSVAR